MKGSHEINEKGIPDQPVSLQCQYSQEGQGKFPLVGFVGVLWWVKFLLLLLGFLEIFLCLFLVHQIWTAMYAYGHYPEVM